MDDSKNTPCFLSGRFLLVTAFKPWIYFDISKNVTKMTLFDTSFRNLLFFIIRFTVVYPIQLYIIFEKWSKIKCKNSLFSMFLDFIK